MKIEETFSDSNFEDLIKHNIGMLAAAPSDSNSLKLI